MSLTPPKYKDYLIIKAIHRLVFSFTLYFNLTTQISSALITVLLLRIHCISEVDASQAAKDTKEPPKKKSKLLGEVDLNSSEVQKLLKQKSKHTGALAEVGRMLLLWILNFARFNTTKLFFIPSYLGNRQQGALVLRTMSV